MLPDITTNASRDVLLNEDQEKLQDIDADTSTNALETPSQHVPFKPITTRQARKRQRTSQAATVLLALSDEASSLYSIEQPRKPDYSYKSPAPRRPGGKRHQEPQDRLQEEEYQPPISLYTILSQQLYASPALSSPLVHLSKDENTLLEAKGYTTADVERWRQCLLTSSSIVAAEMLRHHQHTPLFVVLLFLRRKRIRRSALSTVIKNTLARTLEEPIDWMSLQLLVIRLLRHARMVWPESIPSIASFFCDEASRRYDEWKQQESASSKFLPNLTAFCNTLIKLIALPTPKFPILSGTYQEKAQFAVLRFMAGCDPALTVSRSGFRATLRSQLSRAKTTQEKEWAMLKGPSWPPWKTNQNAMDEGKEYMFGASRASRILHRMHDAGYDARAWEKIAEVYAGWDTDLSPTIQTRTTLAHSTRGIDFTDAGLWAARIRTTRTPREAWACFLAFEGSQIQSTAKVWKLQEVFLAMFEKLHYLGSEPQASDDGIDPPDSHLPHATTLYPGDMKEILPDPKSPLHHVYLSEPIPTYNQLYHRMWERGIRPSSRLLAFLLDTLPDFSTCMSLLEHSQSQFHGGVQRLLDGTILEENASAGVPDYFLGSFMRFLCRHGRFAHSPPDYPAQPSIETHQMRLKWDKTYLIDYADALLMHIRPAYTPPWTEYMRKIVYGKEMRRSATSQYHVITKTFQHMSEIDIDPDEDQFLLLCTVARYTAQAAHKQQITDEDGHNMTSSTSLFLRTVFHDFVGVNIDSRAAETTTTKAHILPPHVPSPAVVHAYVRALGHLRDYEGLYSLSSWLATYHKEVTARANAQHGGPKLLYLAMIALRSSLEGTIDTKNPHDGAPQEIIELVKERITSVDDWAWPPKAHVSRYSAKGI